MAHPREGWAADGSGSRGLLNPGVLPRSSRRDFLRQSAGAGLLASGLGSLLAACAGESALTSEGGIPLPRRDHPVTWPIFPGNQQIPSGLAPERDATLRIFNWTDYINSKCLDDFAKKYRCKVELATFYTMNEALTKVHSGEVKPDVFLGVTPDVLGPLIERKYLRPLNHSYIPNMAQVWPDYQHPFYDGRWRYTVPYTIYTTGIAWRKDHVSENPYRMPNGWSFPWQGKYRGKVAVLDDYRESISLGLMRNGIFDLNTTDPAEILKAAQSLQSLERVVGLRIDNNDSFDVPTGVTWIHLAWSGDIAAAPGYLPKGVPVEVLGYWFPHDGRGPVGNDAFTVMRTAKNPVLAHMFINYMIDMPNALTNISWNGYMQPLVAITPELLVNEKILPKTLLSTAVLRSYFRRGLMELQLPPSADADWQQAWLNVSSGV